MGVEIEAKMKVDDLAAIRRRLRALHARRIVRRMEINTFLDTPDSSLRRGDRGLRLRVNQPLPRRTCENVITYKGPRKSGKLKIRPEFELTVADAKDAIALLGCLGFYPTLSFQKRRESWRLGRCRVELDELPRLGSFVEIEGPDDRSVMRTRKRLGLEGRPMIFTSYIAMLMEELGGQAPANRFISFPDSKHR
jgi:adenylate cyclase, class 2